MNKDTPIRNRSAAERPSVLFHILLAAALLIFIQTFSLLSPILLSLFLILLISLAVNPVIARMRAWAGGRKGAAALLAMPMIMAKGMRLHPLAVVFSMLLCVAAFGVLGVLVASPLVAIVCILHDELYRKRFLPTVTDAELDQLSLKALHEKAPAISAWSASHWMSSFATPFVCGFAALGIRGWNRYATPN